MEKFLTTLFLILMTSCDSPVTDSSPSEETVRAEKQPVEIQYSTAALKDFTIEKMMNGIIVANSKSTIRSEIPGKIISYSLDEGSYIRKGAPLIRLDTSALFLDMEKAQNELDNAIIERNNRIIRDGGISGDESSVNAEKLSNFNILSGYNKAHTAIKELEFMKEKMTIPAPISGWITDISVNRYEYINAGQEICTIIDPDSYEIKIYALESDAIGMDKSTKVTAHPLLNPGQTINGRITKINPVVDENGIVEVYASITGMKSNLFEGMNVRVTVQNILENQIVIPKSALVNRSGRSVVFVYDPEKKVAEWKYVTIGNENSNELSIIDGIAVGNLVITEGNLNLDHNASVQLKETQ